MSSNKGEDDSSTGLLLSFRFFLHLPAGHYTLATLGQVQLTLSPITLNSSPPLALRHL